MPPLRPVTGPAAGATTCVWPRPRWSRSRAPKSTGTSPVRSARKRRISRRQSPRPGNKGDWVHAREPDQAQAGRGGHSFGAMMFEFFSPGMPQIVRAAGAEFVLFDMEHSGIGIETVKAQIAACRVLGIVPGVRVPATQPATKGPTPPRARPSTRRTPRHDRRGNRVPTRPDRCGAEGKRVPKGASDAALGVDLAVVLESSPDFGRSLPVFAAGWRRGWDSNPRYP